MKKYIIYSILSCMFLVSCSNDFLNQDPITEPLTELVFSNQETIELLIPGAYQPMKMGVCTDW